MMIRVSDVVKSTADKYLKWWRMTSDGKNINGACPFHHETTEGAFYMSTENGLFICHGCQARGSFPTFLKEVGAPARVRATIMNDIGKELVKKAERPNLAIRDQFKGHMALNEGLLGIFDFCPTSLVEAGFSPTVLKTHEVGFDKKALRITFPIRNHLGVLMGVAGRTVVDEDPRYKIYKEEDLIRFSDKYRGYDFHKKNFLWNFHNVYPQAFHGDLDIIFVVEGYKAALWLIQHGFLSTVAIMGSYLSEMQRALLQRLNAEIYVLLDNTHQARKGAYDAGKRLRGGNKVFICDYPLRCEGGEQPDDLSQEELEDTIFTAMKFNSWRMRYERTQSQRRR
jgi:DNA primase